MTGEMWISLGHGVASMALAAICYGLLLRAPLVASHRSILIGMVFGVSACLMMSSPVHIAEGTIMDGRFVTIGIAGLFGGFPAAMVSAVMAGAYRASLGGQGMLMGILSIVFAGLLGLAWRRHFAVEDNVSWKSLGLFGIMLSVHVLFILFIPIADATRVMLATWMASLPLYCATAVAFGLMMLRERSLIDREKNLERLNKIDHLTGLANRRCFVDRTERALKHVKEYERNFAILMIDIDHFKYVNDTYGHDAGDRALIAVAEVLRSVVNSDDLAARYGGEEFAVFLPYATPNQALMKAQAIRNSIENRPVPFERTSFKLTASIGMTTSRDGSESAQTIISKADEALYEAKRNGRNCVEADKYFVAADESVLTRWAIAV